uniref:Uncharacterized protein n=1 Tax=Oncorhynchus kisutch TaxID=8019 RepID=A0A8C7KZT2_ONCKI
MCILSYIYIRTKYLFPQEIAVVLEGEVVVTFLSTLAEGFIGLFSMVYTLHLRYSKELTNTFEFIQKLKAVSNS